MTERNRGEDIFAPRLVEHAASAEDIAKAKEEAASKQESDKDSE